MSVYKAKVNNPNKEAEKPKVGTPTKPKVVVPPKKD